MDYSRGIQRLDPANIIFIWCLDRRVDNLGFMKLQTLLGIALIVVGLGLLAYGGFTTTSREKILEVGALKVQADMKEQHDIPPAVSIGVVAVGLALLATGLKKR